MAAVLPVVLTVPSSGAADPAFGSQFLKRHKSLQHDPAFGSQFLKRHKSLRHLLHLRRRERKDLLTKSVQGTEQAYLLRKADEKARKLLRKNHNMSVAHCKGERRKSHRPGRGKGGWIFTSIFMDGVWDVVEEVREEDPSRDAAKAARSALRRIRIRQRTQAEAAKAARSEAAKAARSALRWGIVSYRALRRLQESMPKLAPQLALEWTFPATHAFKKLCEYFLQSHGAAIRQALSPYLKPSALFSPYPASLFGFPYYRREKETSLNLAPLNPVVQMRFLRALAGRHSLLQPAFHGTEANNLSSIFSRGLLIPGSESDIQVVNGSAHGVGIYTARLTGASISIRFNRGSTKMLVCAVIDDAVELSAPERIGNYGVTARSSAVHHVGDAMVVFDNAFVVPLLIAEVQGTAFRRW